MPVPDYQTLMPPVLRHAATGETRVPEVADQIADEMGLTPEERERRLTGGQRLLHNRVHWAKFYMSKAGLISSPRRGRFVTSEEGRAVLARKPDRIDVNFLLKYPAFTIFIAAVVVKGMKMHHPRQRLTHCYLTRRARPKTKLTRAI
jgi:restriction system protein